MDGAHGGSRVGIWFLVASIVVGCGERSDLVVDEGAPQPDPETVASCLKAAERCFPAPGYEEACSHMARFLDQERAREFWDCVTRFCEDSRNWCPVPPPSQAVYDLLYACEARLDECDLGTDVCNIQNAGLFAEAATRELSQCLDEDCELFEGCLQARLASIVTPASPVTAVDGSWCGRPAMTPEQCGDGEVGYLELQEADGAVTGIVCEAFDHGCSVIENGTRQGERITFEYRVTSDAIISDDEEFQAVATLTLRDSDGLMFGSEQSTDCNCSEPIGYLHLAE